MQIGDLRAEELVLLRQTLQLRVAVDEEQVSPVRFVREQVDGGPQMAVLRVEKVEFLLLRRQTAEQTGAPLALRRLETGRALLRERVGEDRFY